MLENIFLTSLLFAVLSGLALIYLTEESKNVRHEYKEIKDEYAEIKLWLKGACVVSAAWLLGCTITYSWQMPNTLDSISLTSGLLAIVFGVVVLLLAELGQSRAQLAFILWMKLACAASFTVLLGCILTYIWVT